MLVGATPEAAKLRAEAHRTSQRIKIDGELSESDWGKVEPIRRFVQIEPDEGKLISQPTEVRVLYDNRNLYLGFSCFDNDISKLVANELRRDSRLWENDSVYVLLDTYNDQARRIFLPRQRIGSYAGYEYNRQRRYMEQRTGMRFGRAAPRLATTDGPQRLLFLSANCVSHRVT